jgi:hypothetical protein
VGLAEVGEVEFAAGAQHPAYLAERAGLVRARQMVKDEARQHAVERALRVWQRVGHRLL